MPRKKNSSGMDPIGFRLVVKPRGKEKVSKGGIIIPETTADRQGDAVDRGEVVALGGMAFTGNSFQGWDGRKPEVGETVIFPRYGGMVFKGSDGENYRLLNDEDIPAVLE